MPPHTCQAPQAPDAYIPDRENPIHCVLRPYQAQTEVALHAHPWIQMVYAAQGVVRVHTPHAAYTAPPGRAIWIPAAHAHCANVLEQAALFVIYILHAPNHPDTALSTLAHRQCAVLEMPALLRALLTALAEENRHSQRYQQLSSLTFTEINRAPRLPLGIALPSDKRLAQVCRRIMAQPEIRTPLSELIRDSGASLSTIQRLAKAELGCSFQHWRQQVIFAHAFRLAAQGCNISQIADALGYSGISAFSYSIRQALGMTPSRLLCPPVKTE